MKTLQLNIPDDIYAELKSHFDIRNIIGTFHGPIDGFNALVFQAIDKGAKDLTLERRKPDAPPLRKGKVSRKKRT